MYNLLHYTLVLRLKKEENIRNKHLYSVGDQNRRRDERILQVDLYTRFRRRRRRDGDLHVDYDHFFSHLYSSCVASFSYILFLSQKQKQESNIKNMDPPLLSSETERPSLKSFLYITLIIILSQEDWFLRQEEGYGTWKSSLTDSRR